jgi:hypothetical protein
MKHIIEMRMAIVLPEEEETLSHLFYLRVYISSNNEHVLCCVLQVEQIYPYRHTKLYFSRVNRYVT